MENIAKSHKKVDEISPLTLAFVGDGVYDLLVRDYLVNLANRPVGELNKIKVSFVNCTSQARFAKFLLPYLTEKETAVYKREETPHRKPRQKTVRLPTITSQQGLKVCSDIYISAEKKREYRSFLI